jgi:hypothetical protein
MELSRRMTDVLLIPRVVFTDIDERRNRLLVAVEDAATQARVEAALVQMNVPREAVIIEFRGPIEDLSHQTLSSNVRPMQGGLLIYFQTTDGTYVPCSLGPNARGSVTGAEYFITASHCSRRRGDGRDDTPFFQYDPTNNQFQPIGIEIWDPSYFGKETDSRCPDNARCRYSDATLVEYTIHAADVAFGYIARTTSSSRLTAGSTEISHTAPRFTIIGEYYYPIDGEPLEKIGYASGWTWGGVRAANSCVNVPRLNPPDLVYICQAVVDSFAARGDSGAPVFSWVGGNDVNVIGTLLGQLRDDTSTHYVFSPMSGIVTDLGNLYTYDQGPEPNPCAPQIIC